MSVLFRWGRSNQGDAQVAIFVTRSLPDAPDPRQNPAHERDDLRWIYARVEDVVRSVQGRAVVIPCDELGVCPTDRELAKSVSGLPAYFFGIRPWLRRKLCEAYGCRAVSLEHDATVEASFAALQLAEERLKAAEDMIRSIEEALVGVTDVEARLRGPRRLFEDARAAHARALARYHGAWLSSLGGRQPSLME